MTVISLRFQRGKNRGGPSCKKVLPDPLLKNFHHFSECSFPRRKNEHSESRGNFLPEPWRYLSHKEDFPDLASLNAHQYQCS